MKTKKIILDFETDRSNPATAEPIEATFLFIEDDKIINTLSSKLLIDHMWREVKEDKELLDTYKFNGIESEEDLDKHNKEAIDSEKFFRSVMSYLKEFTGGFWISLTGWNNAGFDNLIFRRVVDNIEPGFFRRYINYHARDIYHNYRVLKGSENHLGEVNLMKLNLKSVHTNLIGTMSSEDFHKSLNDCLAVKDLDEWFNKKVEINLK